MIRYNCTHCGEEMQSPESVIGRVEVCPQCGMANFVPAKTMRSEKKKKKPASKENMVISAVLIALLGLFLIVWYVMDRLDSQRSQDKFDQDVRQTYRDGQREMKRINREGDEKMKKILEDYERETERLNQGE